MTSVDPPTPSRSRRPLWLGLSALALVLLTFTGAALSAYAHGGFGRWHRGMAHGHDPELVHRHLEFMTSWVLEELDVDDEQMAAIQPRIRRAADELLALAEEHDGQREIFHQLLTEPEIDRVALEEQRRNGLDLADRASRILVDALADVASELSQEQRQALAERAHQRH